MSRFDPDAIKAQNPILEVLKRYGHEPKHTTSGEVYFLCPFHDESTASFRVNPDKNGGVYTCGGCQEKGDAITFVQKKENISFAEACKMLGGSPGEPWRPPRNGGNGKAEKPPDSGDWTRGMEPECVYDYLDEFGNLAYQALRYERPNPNKSAGYEKTFKQRKPDGAGGWIWKTDGVKLVLYRLPEILSSSPRIVSICEGEKDCNTLWDMGFPATTNVSGAGKWKDPYSESLRDRDVAVWPDQDDIGRKHSKEVFESVSQRARSVRIVNVPKPFKDVTEWWQGFVGTDAEFASEIQTAIEQATPMYRGVELPVKSMVELEQNYIKTSREAPTVMLELSRWLPSFRPSVRGLVPGELIVFMGETGIGKTALLQNLAISAAPLTTLLFEIELPEELTFERFVAAGYREESESVFNLYASGKSFDWRAGNKLGHIFVCSKSDLNCADIERIVVNSELKIGDKPRLVLIDYVGLVRSVGKSRYERVSDIAEHLKVIAKATKTIIVIASQIHRRLDAKGPEITLYDAKDSGSIENSSGLVLGAWRDPKDRTLMKVRVLKNTKGRPGLTIDCNFNGATMCITERIIDPADIPTSPQPALIS